VRLLTLIAVLAFVTSGVAGAAANSRHTGVLHGVVTRGPGCSPGTTQPCADPIAGVNIVFLQHGRAAGQTTTTDAGTYRIRLHAGRYGIRVPGRSEWQPNSVLVMRGQVTRINIEIDALRG